jgi:hypothetical protein
VRTITRGISALMVSIGLLNPLKYGFFSWQLFTHKFMRWMVPLFMAAAFAANIILATKRRLYFLILVLHALFYVLAALGPVLAGFSSVFKIPVFLCLLKQGDSGRMD